MRFRKFSKHVLFIYRTLPGCEKLPKNFAKIIHQSVQLLNRVLKSFVQQIKFYRDNPEKAFEMKDKFEYYRQRLLDIKEYFNMHIVDTCLYRILFLYKLIFLGLSLRGRPDIRSFTICFKEKWGILRVTNVLYYGRILKRES